MTAAGALPESVRLVIQFPVDDQTFSDLHARAFGSPGPVRSRGPYAFHGSASPGWRGELKRLRTPTTSFSPILSVASVCAL